MSQDSVVIVDGARTPMGGFQGDLKDTKAPRLGAVAIKSALPQMHIHAFSPFEIWYGASKTKMSYADFLQDLKECGLGSMPGTAAEILDTEVRQKLTKNKLSANFIYS